MLRLALLIVLLLPLAARAGDDDPDPDAPPLVGQPKNFSGSVGSYAVATKASLTEVPVEKPLTLVVTITGKGPEKHQPRREALRIFPEGFEDDFFVEPLPEKDAVDLKRGKWDFAFTLRPKHAKVTHIPALTFSYYNPRLKRFQAARTGDDIPLKVTEKPKVEAPGAVPRVLEPPPQFYAVTTGPEVLTRGGHGPSAATLAALAAGPPLACLVGFVVWRRLYPDAGRVAQRQRSKAAGVALKAIAALPTGDGFGAAAAVAGYLRARAGLRVLEPTPSEIDTHLRRVGLRAGTADQVADFFRRCDAARFAPEGVAGRAALTSDAAAIIELLEGEWSLRLLS